jgi:zinc-binding alcohol dehydrogenase family protein
LSASSPPGSVLNRDPLKSQRHIRQFWKAGTVRRWRVINVARDLRDRGIRQSTDLSADPAGRPLDETGRSARPPLGGRIRHFEKPTGANVVDIAVDRNAAGHERVGADAPDVFDDAALKIGKGEPLNVPTVNRARSDADIAPAIIVQFGGFETLAQEMADDLVGKKLHAAIRVVNDEPFTGSQQLVGNDQRPDRVVAGPPAGIANDMHVSLIGASLSPSGTMLDPLLLTGRGITVGAISVGSRADFEAMNRAIALHRLQPVDRTFPFADAKAAYRHFEGRGHFGKVVITHD